MNTFKIYQILCCVICCELLCLYPQIAHAKRKRAKAFKRYLATIKQANDLFFNPNIKLEKLKTMLSKYKKREHKARYRRKRNVHVNYVPHHIVMAMPTNVIKCRIFCRSGLYLQLLSDGSVKGTVNQLDRYTLLEIQSFGPSLVRIKSLFSRRYLAIDIHGRLTASTNPRLPESLFKEIQEENSYNSYSSFKYFYDEPYDIFLGIRTTGQVKKTWKAYPGQIATQFIVIKNQ